MIVYHSSDHFFTKPRIYNKKFLPERTQVQGPGIYFTTGYNNQYGKYVYELEIPDDLFLAYKFDVLYDYFKEACFYIKHLSGIDIEPFVREYWSDCYSDVEFSCFLYNVMLGYYSDAVDYAKMPGMNHFMKRLVMECDFDTITNYKRALSYAREFDKIHSPGVYLFESDTGVIKCPDAVCIKCIHFCEDETRLIDTCWNKPWTSLLL